MRPLPSHHGWWLPPVTVRDVGGPTRVQTDEKQDKTFSRRPVGFTANLEERVKYVTTGPEHSEEQQPEDGPQLSLF